jgi:hypothetical protein
VNDYNNKIFSRELSEQGFYLNSTHGVKTDFYDNCFIINSEQDAECHKESLINSLTFDNIEDINLDLNCFEDQLENLIMLDNLPQQQFSTTTPTITMPQSIIINRQNSTANILNSMEIKTADINATDYSQLFRGLSTFELADSFTINNQEGVKSIKQEDLADMLIQQQSEVQANKDFGTLSTVKLVPDNSNNNKENLAENNLLQPRLISSSQRTSTDSNTSSVVNVQKKKRGRRPTSMLDASNKPATNRQPTKRERIIEEAHDNGSKVVCFGNKVVEKDTEEYKKRRVSNNEAVKKCRQKGMEEQKEKEERMKYLDSENKRLNNKVDTLQKELSVLKNILLQMSPHKKIPEQFEKMIKAADEA